MLCPCAGSLFASDREEPLLPFPRAEESDPLPYSLKLSPDRAAASFSAARHSLSSLSSQQLQFHQESFSPLAQNSLEPSSFPHPQHAESESAAESDFSLSPLQQQL